MHARAWCEVDLDAVRHNLSRLRQVARVPLIPMVKADAYGLGADGMVRVCAQLAGNEAPWALGVATVDEGDALRHAGWNGRILCCSPVLPSEFDVMHRAEITPALHREADILAWRRIGDRPWHLSIDTGMNRAGVAWQAVAALRDVVSFHPPEGVFTHFHSAGVNETSRATQEQRFLDALQLLALPAHTLTHAANSHALASDALSPQSHTRPRWDLARPGIALYGSPAASALGLQPVLHVYARVIDVREVAAGETVSYDATWTAPRASRIATVGIGHGDGYRRAFSNRGVMQLRGAAVPVVGVVTMDMTMLDVTNVPCEIGDVVTVLGAPPGNASETITTIDALAALGELSPYELLVGWRLRLPRVYRSAT